MVTRTLLVVLIVTAVGSFSAASAEQVFARGIVRYDHGGPVAGVEVSLTEDPGFSSLFAPTRIDGRAVTDARGRFRIAVPPKTVGRRLTLVASGRALTTMRADGTIIIQGTGVTMLPASLREPVAFVVPHDFAPKRRSTSKPSNQAMQRTAGRSAFPLPMTSTFNQQQRPPSPAVADLRSR